MCHLLMSLSPYVGSDIPRERDMRLGAFISTEAISAECFSLVPPDRYQQELNMSLGSVER